MVLRSVPLRTKPCSLAPSVSYSASCPLWGKLLCWLFLLFILCSSGKPATQLPNKYLEVHFFLSLTCFLPAFLNLKFPIYLLPLGFFILFFLFLYIFSFLLILSLAGWLVLSFLAPPSPLPRFFLLFILCLPTPPILSPALLLAIQLFIRPIRCFRGKVTQLYRVKQMQHKRMKHIFTSLNKYSTA